LRLVRPALGVGDLLVDVLPHLLRVHLLVAVDQHTAQVDLPAQLHHFKGESRRLDLVTIQLANPVQRRFIMELPQHRLRLRLHDVGRIGPH